MTTPAAPSASIPTPLPRRWARAAAAMLPHAARTSARWPSRRSKRRSKPESLPSRSREGIEGWACTSHLAHPPPAPPASGRGAKEEKWLRSRPRSVKELRERTGAGMMDCKKALAENNGEMEAAIDWLRAKGLAAAAKKAGRTAAEGLVGVAVEGNRGAVVEVNSETDFVAKNEIFQDFVRNVAKLALEQGTDVEALGTAQYPDGGTVTGEADRQYRQDRRESVASPRGGARSERRARSSPTSTTRSLRASARSACWSRSKARRRPTR